MNKIDILLARINRIRNIINGYFIFMFANNIRTFILLMELIFFSILIGTYLTYGGDHLKWKNITVMTLIFLIVFYLNIRTYKRYYYKADIINDIILSKFKNKRKK